jgi:type II secretory pathway pseudopilin PulG
MIFLMRKREGVFFRQGAARTTFVTRKSGAGFTLIETMVYLSLFSLMMGGVVVSAYNIFESTGRSQTRSMIQEEGDFIIGKIDWSLSGIQVVSAPAAPSSGSECTESDTLSVTKWDGSVGTIIINLSGGSIVLARLGNLANSTPLNNSNITVSGLLFRHCGGGGNNPESVEASFTLTARTPNGMSISRDFFTSDYIRK